MKKTLYMIIFLITISFYSYGQIKTANFGTRFIDTVSLPSNDNYIKSVTLKSLPKKDSRKFYNSNVSNSNFEIDNSKKVTVVGKSANKHTLLIPPLKPNRFYQLEIKYVGKYNIYGIFRGMYEEGLTLYEEDKQWMEIVKYLNLNCAEIKYMQLLYHPQNYELKNLKSELVNIDFNNIDTLKLEKIYYSNFEILNFRKDEISIDTLISFSNWALNKDEFSQVDGVRFISSFNKIPDYLRMYDFFIRRIKPAMDNIDFNDPTELINFIKKEAESENQELKARYSELFPDYIMPNYTNTNVLDYLINYTEENNLSTYAKNFETSYKRTLVPDFGYLAYIPYSGSVKGGSPYIGVHIQLSPINKDVPLSLSQLTIAQRLSIHTGMTLNSMKEENYRDNFFSKYSLILGGGYKILTQSTRINFGGVFFKKIDAISGEQSIAVQPYIGISIDIEIKKWLESSIPSFTSNFKGE